MALWIGELSVIDAFVESRLCFFCHPSSFCLLFLMFVMQSLQLLGEWRNGLPFRMRKRQREMPLRMRRLLFVLVKLNMKLCQMMKGMQLTYSFTLDAACTKN